MFKLPRRNVAAAAVWYLMVGAIPSFSAPKPVSIKAIQEFKKSVLPVVCVDEDENHGTRVVGMAGSGLFIDRLGRFLTANHVLNEFTSIVRASRPCTSAVAIPDHGWNRSDRFLKFQSFNTSNCIRDDAVDLAICELPENPFTRTRIKNDEIRPIAFDTREWPDGTSVALTGFPLEQVFPITSRGHIVAKTGIANVNGFDYVMDKDPWPGSGGSALYLENGKVIGVIVKGGIKQGAVSARGADVVIEFLSQHLP